MTNRQVDIVPRSRAAALEAAKTRIDNTIIQAVITILDQPLPTTTLPKADPTDRQAMRGIPLLITQRIGLGNPTKHHGFYTRPERNRAA